MVDVGKEGIENAEMPCEWEMLEVEKSEDDSEDFPVVGATDIAEERAQVAHVEIEGH